MLAEVPPGEVVDWSGDVFPKLLKRGAPLLRLRLRRLLGGRRDPRELPEGAGRRAGPPGADRYRRVRGLARRLGRRGRRGRRGRGAHRPAVHRGLRQDRGGRALARVHRDRQQRRGQGGRVPAPRGGAQQRLRRPGRQPARLRDRQEHRRHAAGQDRGGRRRRGRVRDRARGVPVRRGEGLPVQDHRGRRGGEHQRDLGVSAASAPCSARAACPG